ncbi:MATE family efflux transporter [Corynebacterium ulcerans]|uniref:MATE family efflux transporter n=1 Tax=Corynebacterium ulcerans TaxID=65058 RepID=UPI0034A17A29
MISSIRQLIALGGALAIGFVSQMAISFTDAALVSRLGANVLAGMTLALGLFSLVMLMGLGIVTAVSPKVAESFRNNDNKELQRWFNQGVWLSLTIGGCSAIVLFNTGTILRFFGQNEQIAAIAQEYNCGSAIGVIFFYLYINIRGLMSAVGDPKPLIWVMLAAIPTNFLLASFLIFGSGSFNGFGVLGAGISSTVTRLLIVIWATALLMRGKQFRFLNLVPALSKPEWVRIAHLLCIGIPIGFRILVGEGFPSVIAFMTAAYGPEAVASHAVGIRLDTLISVFALGISSAATTMAAWYRTDSDQRELRRLRTSIAFVGTTYVVLLSTMMYFSYEFMLSTIFGITDVSVLHLSWKLLPLILLSFMFGTWGAMYHGFLVGLLDTVLPTVVVTISYWGIGLVGGYIFANTFNLGFIGYWGGMVLASFTVALFNYLRVSYLIARIPVNIWAVKDTQPR